MSLLIDVGNTRAKWWWRHDGSRSESGVCSASPQALGESLEMAGVAASAAALASVAAPAMEQVYCEMIAKTAGATVHVCRASAECMGLVNSYQDPGAMGVDRWLAMLAAWYPGGQAVCVVDAGTALTIDLVAADGRHVGGYIIPGPLLMQESLTARASRISVPAVSGASLAPGQSTQACVSHGAWLAAASAVAEVLRQHPAHRLVVCGGDGGALLGLGLNGEWRADLIRDGLALWLAEQVRQSRDG